MDSCTIAALESFPEQLATLFGSLPRAAVHWAPPSWEGIPSETLTALEQVSHVRDIEVDGYQVRLNRVLSETNPTLASIDTYALCRERRYHDADATQVLEHFHLARMQTVQLIRSLDETQLQRPGQFEGYGPVTARGLVHYLCSHDQQHLAGVQWLLGQFHSQR